MAGRTRLALGAHAVARLLQRGQRPGRRDGDFDFGLGQSGGGEEGEQAAGDHGG